MHAVCMHLRHLRTCAAIPPRPYAPRMAPFTQDLLFRAPLLPLTTVHHQHCDVNNVGMHLRQQYTCAAIPPRQYSILYTATSPQGPVTITESCVSPPKRTMSQLMTHHKYRGDVFCIMQVFRVVYGKYPSSTHSVRPQERTNSTERGK